MTKKEGKVYWMSNEFNIIVREDDYYVIKLQTNISGS